jgi:hypothetical protein
VQQSGGIVSPVFGHPLVWHFKVQLTVAELPGTVHFAFRAILTISSDYFPKQHQPVVLVIFCEVGNEFLSVT